MTTPASADALRAFEVEEAPRLLSGGQGGSWLAGDLVLKPGGGPVLEWLAEALTAVVADGFRLGAPVRARDGQWSCDGWTATRWVEGDEPDRSSPSGWLDVLVAGRALHRALAELERPDCLAGRDDRWAVADRAAWDEVVVGLRPELADTGRRLGAALEPLGACQVVHADLTGNVLVSPGLPPAVIDVSPLWRPTAYAEGVVVADALCWHGAPGTLPDRVGVPVPAVARALLFRLVTTHLAAASSPDDVDVAEEAERYEAAVAALGL